MQIVVLVCKCRGRNHTVPSVGCVIIISFTLNFDMEPDEKKGGEGGGRHVWVFFSSPSLSVSSTVLLTLSLRPPLTLSQPEFVVGCHCAGDAPPLSLFKSNGMSFFFFFERLGWELTPVWLLVSGDSHLGFTMWRPAVFAAIWSAVLSVIRVFLWRGEGSGAVRTSRENAQVRAELSAQGWGEADIFHQHREFRMDHLIVFPLFGLSLKPVDV